LDQDTYAFTTPATTTTTDDLSEDPEQADESRKLPDSPKQTKPKQIKPKMNKGPKRDPLFEAPTEYRGEDAQLSRDKNGNVYVSEKIIQWIKDDEQADNPEYKELHNVANNPWAKYTDDEGLVFTEGPHQAALDAFMDLGDDSESDAEDDDEDKNDDETQGGPW